MGSKSIQRCRTRCTDSGLAAQVRLWRENVLDLDVLVDDKRAAASLAVYELREAVRERDRAAVHLAHLIDLALQAGAEQPAA